MIKCFWKVCKKHRENTKRFKKVHKKTYKTFVELCIVLFYIILFI